MASIKARNGKNGTTYLITVSVGRDTNGKKLTETTTFKPTKTTPKAIKKEVQKYALDFEERVKNGKYFSGEKVTFYDVSKQWEPDAKEKLSPATFESYQGILDKHIYPVIGNMRISKINAMILQDMVKKWKAEDLAPASIRRYFAVVSLVFKYAYRLGIIESNPCDRVELPKASALSNTDIHCFDVEQVNRFLDLVENGFTIDHPERTVHRCRYSYYTAFQNAQERLLAFLCLFPYQRIKRPSNAVLGRSECLYLCLLNFPKFGRIKAHFQSRVHP